MKKYNASQKRVDLYDIGEGLTLMNVLIKNEEGKLDSIDTYIGAERNGFSCVGHTEKLAEPGVIFSYSQYIRMISANIGGYKEIFFQNISK